MTTQIEEYYKLFMEKKEVIVPIVVLHDIRVEIIITKLAPQPNIPESKIGTIIRQQDTYFSNSRNIEPEIIKHALEYSIKGFQESIDRLDTIKFSKKNNKFYYGEEESTFESLYNGTNYSTIYEECSVCMETTKRKTICKHPLCMQCFFKLTKPRCPLCRKCIVEDDYHEDHDDEDE